MDHTVSERDGTVIVAIEGEIDLESSPVLRQALLDALPRGRSMVVDMAGVTLIDSSGVASLLEAFQESRKKGRNFSLSAVNDTVMRVLSLAHLDTVFPFIEGSGDG